MSARWISEQMSSELAARRAALLSEKATLQQAAARILEIDETVEEIDKRLAQETAARVAMPEVARAEPAA